MKPASERISDAEAEVMKVVWHNNNPVTYKDIRTELAQNGGVWESTTINTFVRRLVKKGLLIKHKNKIYYYSATVTEAEYMEDKTKEFVRKIFGGNVKDLLSALVLYKEIDQDELEHLKACLLESSETQECN